MDSLYEFHGKDFPCRACPECKVLRGLKRSRVEIMQPRRVVSERERGREVRSACTASPRRTDGRTERRRSGAAPLFAAQEAKARPTDGDRDGDRRGKWKRRSTNATRVQWSADADADEQTQTTLRGVADFQRAVLLRQSSLLEGVATD